MNFPFRLTFQDVVLVIAGLLLAALGVWNASTGYARILGIGLFFVGAGTVGLGVTNGFTDSSPLGVKIYKASLVSYILGLPVLLYGLSRYL